MDSSSVSVVGRRGGQGFVGRVMEGVVVAVVVGGEVVTSCSAAERKEGERLATGAAMKTFALVCHKVMSDGVLPQVLVLLSHLGTRLFLLCYSSAVHVTARNMTWDTY